MKLTKSEIRERQAELVATLLRLDELGKQKKSLVAMLDEDFKANEAKYRNGVMTQHGVLIRKPAWCFEAKPIVEAA